MADPKKKLSWVGTSWLMLADIIGTSVLTFAGVARQLGWVLTIVFIVGLCPVSIYSAMLMWRTRTELAGFQVAPTTMGEAAKQTLGGDTAASVVYFAVYLVFTFFGNTSYLLVLGEALQGMFYYDPICLPTAVLVSCLVCAPVVVSTRRLSDSVRLCFLNLFVLLGGLAIVVMKFIQDGPQRDARTFLFAEDLTFMTAFGAMTNILYSYTGHWMYFELMAEMRDPEDFPRVFIITAPVQVILYLFIACIGYYYTGDKAESYFLDNLPMGPAFRVASLLLFVHVVIVFLIKNVVLTRYVHRMISPKRFQEGSLRAHIEHSSCALALILAGFFVANSIPFFSDFLGLVGGFLSGPISFLLPMAFFVGAQQLKGQSRMTPGIECPSLGRRSNPEEALEVIDKLCPPSKAPKIQNLVDNSDLAAFVGIGLLVVLTMCVGTSSVIFDIVQRTKSNGLPFSCKALAWQG